MAVLRIPLAPGGWRWRRDDRDEADEGTRPDEDRFWGCLVGIFTTPLPPDMSREECSVAVLYRSSQALNYVTGGAADMTFSARCHAGRRASRSASVRMGWHVMAMGIDTVCGAMRGESEHCATAWVNHVTRKGQSD